jgi:hypothetical protein
VCWDMPCLVDNDDDWLICRHGVYPSLAAFKHCGRKTDLEDLEVTNRLRDEGVITDC